MGDDDRVTINGLMEAIDDLTKELKNQAPAIVKIGEQLQFLQVATYNLQQNVSHLETTLRKKGPPGNRNF